MSIDRETFEESSEEELEEYSAVDNVLGFLASNGNRAFKAKEIARQTDLDEGAVSTALTRLKNRDLVKHKGQYWAITADDTRRENYEGYARATALYNEQYGSEDRDAWEEHAPEDEHPTVSGDDE
jgi:Mn-dependent DtxR family transcriptional regulator